MLLSLVDVMEPDVVRAAGLLEALVGILENRTLALHRRLAAGTVLVRLAERPLIRTRMLDPEERTFSALRNLATRAYHIPVHVQSLQIQVRTACTSDPLLKYLSHV